MKTKANEKVLKIFTAMLPLVTIAVLLVIWAVSARAIGIEIILPTVSASFKEFFVLLGTTDFYIAVGSTILRAVIAFALSFLTASICVLLSKKFTVARQLLSPLLFLAKITPSMSIILLVVIWFKSFYAPIVVAFVVVFPLHYSQLLSGVNGVSNDLKDMAKVFKADNRQLFKMYKAELLPSFLDTVSSSLALSLKITISAEVISFTQKSIGINIQNANLALNTASLIAWTIAAILIGCIVELCFWLIKRRIKWKI